MQNVVVNGGTKIKKSSKTFFCKSCQKDVTPKVVFYQNEPECTVCPECNAKLKTFRNNSKLEDRLLVKIVAISIVIYFIALLV